MANELTEFDKKILELLKEQGPLNARDIAQKLNLNGKGVNFALLGNLKSYCKQDNKYNWYLDPTVPYPLAAKKVTEEKKDFIEILKGHSIDELATYLAETPDIMNKPQDLLIIPMIKKVIMDSSQIKLIIQTIHDNNIDLNTNAYYLNRTDALKGVDLVGGILFYLMSFAVHKQKRALTAQEVDAILCIINEAVSQGWRKDNPLANNRTIKDLVYMYMSKKHPELKPVYSLLVAETVSTKTTIIQKEDVKKEEVVIVEQNDGEVLEEKEVVDEQKYLSPVGKKILDDAFEDQTKPLKGDEEIFNSVKMFLDGIAVNGYIDPAYISNKTQIGQNLADKYYLCGCRNIKELVEECGLQVGPIQGNVQFETNTTKIISNNDVEKVLNQKIKDFSNRSFNRLTMYGVKTNKDLLNLDLTEFAKFRGVGVVDEVSARIKQLREECLKLSVNTETLDKVEDNKEQVVQNNPIQPEIVKQNPNVQIESTNIVINQDEKKANVDNTEKVEEKPSQQQPKKSIKHY